MANVLIVLCRVIGYSALKANSSPKLANQVSQIIRAAGLRSGLMAKGHCFVYSGGNFVFVRMEAGENWTAEQAKQIAAELTERLYQFLYRDALDIMEACLIQHHPTLKKRGVDIKQEIKALALESRGLVCPMPDMSLRGALDIAERELKNWE